MCNTRYDKAHEITEFQYWCSWLGAKKSLDHITKHNLKPPLDSTQQQGVGVVWRMWNLINATRRLGSPNLVCVGTGCTKEMNSGVSWSQWMETDLGVSGGWSALLHVMQWKVAAGLSALIYSFPSSFWECFQHFIPGNMPRKGKYAGYL